jgi:hypothetical protein
MDNNGCAIPHLPSMTAAVRMSVGRVAVTAGGIDKTAIDARRVAAIQTTGSAVHGYKANAVPSAALAAK